MGWNFLNQNLTGARFHSSMLENANFQGANLTSANFVNAVLTDADLTNALVHGSSFARTTAYGFTANQLYSTSSYQMGNLAGTVFIYNDLTNWDFSGINLSNTYFNDSILQNTNFSDAIITGAALGKTTDTGFTPTQLYSTASYQGGNLKGITLGGDLSNWNFSGQDLSNANFSYKAMLVGTDFSGAIIRGADFTWTTAFGFTSAQLYSTASYQSGDLSGISLQFNDLTGWDFSNQNITNANLAGLNDPGAHSILIDANFAGAMIQGTDFSRSLGFTAEQLYSTESYQAGDLSGIKLSGNDLFSWDFVGQKLVGADFWG